MLNGLVLIELFSTLSFTFYTMPQSPIPSSTFFSMLFLCRCFYVPFTHMHTPIEASESMLGLVSCPLRLVHADKSNHLLYHLSYSHHRAKSSASSQKQECSPPLLLLSGHTITWCPATPYHLLLLPLFHINTLRKVLIYHSISVFSMLYLNMTGRAWSAAPLHGIYSHASPA